MVHRHDYDVVIIGSGIGGLTTGAYLARWGIDVLVCEQHLRPGGCFTSFRTRGYTFDAGIQGCEDTGLLLPVLRQLALLDRLGLRRSKLGFAMPGFFRPLEDLSDLEGYYEHVQKLFPQERQAVARIRQEALELCRVLDALAHAPNPMFRGFRHAVGGTPGWLLEHAAGLQGLRKFGRLLRIPMDEYLSTFVRDPRLVRFLSAGYRGTPAAFSMTFLYTMMDYYYPSRGGIQAIPDLLTQCIQENGGEVRCRSLVQEILVEDNRAVGVVLENGERIRARFVVNNGDLRRTFSRMVPQAAVPLEYRRRLEQSRVSESVFSVYLGVDLPRDAIPTRGCAHIFLMPTREPPDLSEMDADPDFYRHGLLMLMVPSLHDPNLAPRGKSVVILQCAASIRSLESWGTGRDGRRNRKYRERKRRISRFLIANAEQIIPNLSKRIEVQIESTPFTLQRYTLNDQGAAVGWTYHPRETLRGGLRGIFGSSNTPIRNLYQVGHWAMSPGGAPAGLITGKLVSSVILQRLRWGL